MSLATLFSPLITAEDIAEWTFSNRSDHDEIIAAIKRKFGIDVVKYVLEPVTEAGMQAFLINHQAMHQQEALILGVDSQDFLSSDISLWCFDHADQHRRERAALGM